jgi:peptidoglycan/xylan/chitin deacetylase (PgdA/CDA1 family)
MFELVRKTMFLLLRVSLLPRYLRHKLRDGDVMMVAYHAPTPKVFDAHLRALGRVYHFISLAEYVAARSTGTDRALPRHSLIVTLDDGHRTNYQLKDTIEKYRLRPTIFLCSGVIGTARRFWFQHPPIATQVQHLKCVPDEERLRVLGTVGFDPSKEFEDRQALSDSEIRELATTVDFQSHTVSHPILPQCSPSKSRSEIENSKRQLDDALLERVYALAYPNGSYGARETEFAADAGYRCAVTLETGPNSDNVSLFRLRRTCVPDDASVHEAIVKLSGLWSLVTSLRAPVSTPLL